MTQSLFKNDSLSYLSTVSAWKYLLYYTPYCFVLHVNRAAQNIGYAIL